MKDPSFEETTVARLWKDYREKVMPAQCPARQVIETRRAFYAGAGLLLAFVTGPVFCAVDDDFGCIKLTELRDEIQDFVDGVGAGRDAEV